MPSAPNNIVDDYLPLPDFHPHAHRPFASLFAAGLQRAATVVDVYRGDSPAEIGNGIVPGEVAHCRFREDGRIEAVVRVRASRRLPTAKLPQDHAILAHLVGWSPEQLAREVARVNAYERDLWFVEYDAMLITAWPPESGEPALPEGTLVYGQMTPAEKARARQWLSAVGTRVHGEEHGCAR